MKILGQTGRWRQPGLALRPRLSSKVFIQIDPASKSLRSKSLLCLDIAAV